MLMRPFMQVVIANGDVVFGPTLLSVTPLAPGTLHTLSVNGGPRHIHTVYCVAMNKAPTDPSCRSCAPMFVGGFNCKKD